MRKLVNVNEPTAHSISCELRAKLGLKDGEDFVNQILGIDTELQFSYTDGLQLIIYALAVRCKELEERVSRLEDVELPEAPDLTDLENRVERLEMKIDE